MLEAEPGLFQTDTAADQGAYRFRVVATGVTMRGLPFTREQQLSGAVVPGGDTLSPKCDPSTRARDEVFCRFLECLLSPDALGRFLAEQHINPGSHLLTGLKRKPATVNNALAAIDDFLHSP